MAEGPITTLKAVFHPWAIRIVLGAIAVIGAYDAFSNQFDTPRLGKLLGISGSLLPWWGWLLVLQAVFVAALFEYVRRNVPIFYPPPVPAPSSGVPQIGTAELRQLLEPRVKELEGRIETIEGKPVPDAGTGAMLRVDFLEPRIQSAEQAISAVESKQDDLERKVRANAQRAKERDSLVWSFAAAEATIRLLDSVLIEFPKNVQLPVDKQSIDVRRASITLLADFVHTAEIKLQNTVFKDGIANLKRNAANQAEERVAASVENRELRPAGVDPIEWRGDLISEAQAVHIRKWLIAQVHDAKLSIVNLQKELYAEFVQSKS